MAIWGNHSGVTHMSTTDARESSAAAELIARVGTALVGFVERHGEALTDISPDLRPAVVTLRELLGGGKRIRPRFCYWGWRAAGGVDRAEAITAAASLDLLHVSALIHDDIMDDSDLRRGAPTVHRRFAAAHAANAWHGRADRYGAAAAIVLGDLCLSWCDEMFDECGLPPERVAAAKPLLHLMRSEVMAGQFLDLLEQARGRDLPDPTTRARTVIHYKSAKYTVERPLHIGATLAGAGPELLPALSAYGLPLGEAFQLRDDVLGVFGDPAVTGKPAGDDLREGKHTVLIALALSRADAAGRDTLRRGLGDHRLEQPEIAELADIIVSSGALAEAERRISALTARALDAIDATPITPGARDALHELAVAATERVS